MRQIRRFCTLSLLVVICALAVTGTGSARADVLGLGSDTFSLDAPSYVAHENQGTLAITIQRSGDLTLPAVVRYGVKQQTAIDGHDFVAIPNSDATFLPGQSTYTFQVKIIDRGQNSPPLTALAYLYGPYPGQLGANTNSLITIERDDPLDPRDTSNPLGLPAAPADGNVLEGVPFYVAGDGSPAGQAAAQLRSTNPIWADALAVIANSPGSRRFYMWNEPDPAPLVAGYLEGTQVAQPGTTVQLTTYSLVHGHCTGSWSDSPSDVARFQNWINGLAQGIGNFHVALFFEIDSTITNGCLSAQGSYVRMHDELAWAVNRLEQDPHLALYLDGGAADALSVSEEARLLNQAGVHQAQGFFVNATHFDWTSRELYYGQQISKQLGGVHFVVNTGTSGQGPLVPADKVHHGNEVLCNPAGRGLGPFSTSTGYQYADAFLWFDNPGGSGGQCVPGAPPTATFWPAYAVGLVQHRSLNVTGPQFPLTLANGTTTAAGPISPDRLLGRAAGVKRKSKSHHKVRHGRTKHSRKRHR